MTQHGTYTARIPHPMPPRPLSADLRAGQIRLTSRPFNSGVPLTAHDVDIEVCQLDGTWIPLRGVCSYTLRLRSNEMVILEPVLEIYRADITLGSQQLEFLGIDPPQTLLHALWWWKYRFTIKLRQLFCA